MHDFQVVELVTEEDRRKAMARDLEIFMNNSPLMRDCKVSEGSGKEDNEVVDEEEENNHAPRKKDSNLQILWAKGGPVKLLTIPNDSAKGTLFFKNYKKLDHDCLVKLFDQADADFLGIRQMESLLIKVRFQTEAALRKFYNFLKKDPKYEVSVLLDTDQYFAEKKEMKLKRNKFKRIISQGGKIISLEEAQKFSDEIKFDHKPVNKPKLPRLKNEKKKSRSKIGYWKDHVVIVPDVPAPVYSLPPDEKESCNLPVALSSTVEEFCKVNSLDTTKSTSDAFSGLLNQQSMNEMNKRTSFSSVDEYSSSDSNFEAQSSTSDYHSSTPLSSHSSQERVSKGLCRRSSKGPFSFSVSSFDQSSSESTSDGLFCSIPLSCSGLERCTFERIHSSLETMSLSSSQNNHSKSPRSQNLSGEMILDDNSSNGSNYERAKLSGVGRGALLDSVMKLSPNTANMKMTESLGFRRGNLFKSVYSNKDHTHLGLGPVECHSSGEDDLRMPPLRSLGRGRFLHTQELNINQSIQSVDYGKDHLNSFPREEFQRDRDYLLSSS